jgi:hypothetical protein
MALLAARASENEQIRERRAKEDMKLTKDEKELDKEEQVWFRKTPLGKISYLLAGTSAKKKTPQATGARYTKPRHPT